MGQVIFIGFCALGVIWLMIISFLIGYQRGMEDLDSDYERIEKEANDIYRKHRRGNVNATDPIKWDTEPPKFLRECIKDRN